jgi:hypothetical protein
MPSALAELSPSSDQVMASPKFFRTHWLTAPLCRRMEVFLETGADGGPWSLAVAAQTALGVAAGASPTDEVRRLGEWTARLFAQARLFAPVKLREPQRTAAAWREDLVRAVSGVPLPVGWIQAHGGESVVRLRRAWAAVLRGGENFAPSPWLAQQIHDGRGEARGLEAAARRYYFGGPGRRAAFVALAQAGEGWNAEFAPRLVLAAARVNAEAGEVRRVGVR